MPRTLHPEYQVKGTWFVTAHRFLEEQRGEDTLQAVIESMGPEAGPVLADPLASAWYPEDTALEMLRAFRERLCGGNPERYERLMVQMTELGISRFFRALLRLSTPGFVIGQVPTFRRQLRRGPSEVTVVRHERTFVVRYLRFPYFDTEEYRLGFKAQLEALVRTSTSQEPELHITDHDHSTLTVQIDLAG